MSGQRRRYSDRNPSPDPIIIERKPRIPSPSPPPRRRRVSFGLNPFKGRKTVVIKESTIRRRRTERRSRSRSPSPSPPRGPEHTMDPRLKDKYVPLPKKLPLKDERSSSSESSSNKDKRRRRKAILVQGPHPEDRDAYPVVESPGSPSPRRRDSGVFSVEGSPRRRQYYYNAAGQRTYAPSSETSVQDLSDKFQTLLMKEQLDRIEAEKAATRAKEEAIDAKAELERHKRQSWLDERERKVQDRERQHREEQKRISDAPRREVVVVQNKPPLRLVDPATDALDRAKDDYKRRSGRGGKY